MEKDTAVPKTDDLQAPSLPSNGKQPSNLWVILAIILLLALVVGLAFAVVAMVQNPDQTETIRDIVIVMMAVESLVIGLVLVVLIVQIARLTAMLQNEVKPILDSANETVRTLRGTTTFLSSRLVKPVVKVNSTLAAIRRAIDFLRHGK
jgi:hypothetical protein